MRIVTSVIVAILFLGCGTNTSKKGNETLSFVNQDKSGLIGEWKQLKPTIEGYTVKVVFTDKTFTFHVNENEPFERPYHIYKNFIVGPENPVLKKRDSIKYEFIFKDTLILNLLEKGMVYPRKYYQLK
jgi:hypothetical protein